MNTQQRRSRTPFLLIAFCLCYLVVLLVTYTNGIDYFADGPGRRTSEVTRALWDHHTLSPPEFEDIRTRSVAKSLETNTVYWQDAFCLGSDGTLYPKHSLISGFLAVPLYALVGDLGFPLTQGLVFVTLLLSLQRIIQRNLDGDYALTLLLSVIPGTELFYHLNSYSYDMHGTTLIILAIALAHRFPFLSGIAISLSYYVRPTNLLFLPFIALACIIPRSRKDLLPYAAGVLIIALVIMCGNYVMFGHPLVSSYLRIPEINGTELVVRPHIMSFEFSVFFSDWYKKLFDHQVGLVRHNIIYALFPIALYGLTQAKQRQELLILTVGALIYSVYFLGYSHWFVTGSGNRFLLPVTFFYVIPFVIGVNSLYSRFSAGKTPGDIQKQPAISE